MAAATQFSILGPVTVTRNGIAVPIGGRRRLSLLAIFLLHPNAEMSASKLIDLLWNGQPPSGAPNTLQVHVSQLRRILTPDDTEPTTAADSGERLLVTRPSGYALQVERDCVDALRFEDLLAASRAALADGDAEAAWRDMGEARALWHGRALGDLADEAYALVDTARLEESRLQGEHTRTDAGLALGRHRELILDLQRIASEHPLREEFAKQLMLALYRCGRQADALATYRRTREALVESLGIEPDVELQRLEEAILLQKAELDWNPPARSAAVLRMPTTERRVPLTLRGRKAELATLDQAWSYCTDGTGGAVLLGGEPGIGKSWLAAAVVASAARAGATVLQGRCTPDVIVPYQALVEALTPLTMTASDDDLRARLGSGPTRALGDLLSIDSDTAAVSTSKRADRYQQFEAAAKLLQEAARDAPVLLVVEDLHWADHPTLLLIEHLMRRLVASRCLIVGTYRDTDLGAGHPLTNPDGALARRCLVLALSGLGQEDVAALVVDATGERVTENVAAALWKRTSGNPLFVGELLRQIGTTGDALDDALVASEVPAGIRAVISRRISLLGEPTRHILSVAAVAGTEFDVHLVADVANVTVESLASALDSARAARITTDTGDGTATFVHALMAESLLAELGAARRAELHRMIARRIEATAGSNTRARAGELADHFARAGDPESLTKAWRYARDAARYATSRSAPEEAMRRYTDALRLLDRAPDCDDDERGQLSLELGEAAFHAGDRSLSRHAFGSALDAANARGDSERLARVALGSSGWGLQDLWVDYGRVNDSTVELLERALAGTGDGDSALRARLLARLAEELYFDETDRRRLDFADGAVLMARRLDDPVVLAHALHGRLRTREGPDSLAERLSDGREMLAAAGRSGARDLQCVAHGRMAVTLMEAARFDEVERHLAAHARLAEELHSPLYRIWALGMRAANALMHGAFTEAETLIGDAAAISPEQFAAIQAFAGTICVLRVEQGRAREMVDVARQFVSEFPHVPAWRAGLSVLLAEAGEADEARAEVDGILAAGLGTIRRDQNWAFCIAALAETCGRLDDGERAAPVYEQLLPFDGRFIVLGDGYAVWCAVAKSLGILARAGRQFDIARAHLEAALAAHRAAGADALIARTEAELATVLAATGYEREAAEHRLAAVESAARTGQQGVLAATATD
jgi:DNA-binding SARP family transcriptional activator